MSIGRAVLSEVELQPDDFAVQLFQPGEWGRREPMGLFADYFGGSLAQEGFAEKGFAGGFIAYRLIRE